MEFDKWMRTLKHADILGVVKEYNTGGTVIKSKDNENIYHIVRDFGDRADCILVHVINGIVDKVVLDEVCLKVEYSKIGSDK